jgi:hypothetical protein
MALRLGLEARIYRNDETPDSPTWRLIAKVRDVTLNLETGEADVTTRGNNGWRAAVGTLKEASIEFELVWDTADEDFTAIKDCFFNKSGLELLVADGPMNLAGSQGLRAVCQITSFSRSEPLEEAITVSVVAKPTYSAYPPSWITGPITLS